MLNVLVKLTVKDFNALEEFERQAVQVMEHHQGRLITAFETVRNSDGTGEEIHLLAFPSAMHFAHYRADTRLESLASLREKAIFHTQVSVSLKAKSYT